MINIINYILLKFRYPSIDLKRSKIFASWFRCNKKNFLAIVDTKVNRSKINVFGLKNNLEFYNCQISNSIISINGTNNSIIIQKGVKLRNVNIIIRGHNCSIKIDKDTTFGGARIINVGSNNSIIIGNNCLFSDKIEIWASDTHAIYDENNNWINCEKPILIGNNVWVGSDVTILKGVTIEDGAVIGMKTVITKNVLEKTIVAGNPQREIKKNVTWNLDYPNKIT